MEWPSYEGASPGYVDREILSESELLVETPPPRGACKDVPWGKEVIFEGDPKAWPAVKSLEFTPDGKYLILTRDNSVKTLLEVPSGKKVEDTAFADQYRTPYLSPDGRLIMTGEYSDGYEVKALATRAPLGRIKPETSKAAVQFLGGGSYIGSYSTGYQISPQLWASETGAELTFFKAPGKVAELVLSPDNRVVVTEHEGSPDLRVWDLEKKKLLKVLRSPNAGRGKPVISPDGRYVLTTEWDHKYPYALWDTTTGKEIQIPGNDKGTVFLAFTPDSKSVLTMPVGGSDPVLWDLENGVKGPQFKGSDYWRNRVEFTTDGTRLIQLAYGWEGGTAWDVSTGKVTGHFGPPAKPNGFSPDKRFVVVNPKGGGPGKLTDVATGKVLTSFKFKSPLLSATFSSKGDYIATMATDGTIRLQEMKLPCD